MAQIYSQHGSPCCCSLAPVPIKKGGQCKKFVLDNLHGSSSLTYLVKVQRRWKSYCYLSIYHFHVLEWSYHLLHLTLLRKKYHLILCWSSGCQWPRNALEMKSPDLTLFYWMEIVCCVYSVYWTIYLGDSDIHYNLRANVPKRCWIPLRKYFVKSCTKDVQLIFQNWLLYSKLIL